MIHEKYTNITSSDSHTDTSLYNVKVVSPEATSPLYEKLQ